MPNVRAKFYVHSITRFGSGGSVELRAVVRGDENKSWSQATPSGALTMSILNEKALKVFEDALNAKREGGPNPEFYMDFSVANPGDPEA